MKKLINIVVALTMLLSLVAPFRVQTASAAVTAINVTYTLPTTPNLSYYNPVPGFGSAGTVGSATKYVYTMGDTIKGTFTADATGAHTIYLLDEDSNVIDSVTVNVPAAGTYAFTMATSNVRYDGHYYLSADTTANNAGDVEVFIKYNIVFTQSTLQTCGTTQTIAGMVYRATGYPDVAVDVYVTYPDEKLAGWYHVNPTSGAFTITFPADGPDADSTPDIGKFNVYIRDGYSTGIDNDAIIYKTLSNIPTVSLNLTSYITPFIYKNTNNQPIVLVLTDQNGNPVSGATFTLTNATGTHLEISPGFYRFVISVGDVVDVRFKATVTLYSTTLTKELVINTRDLGVFNPWIDINAPYAIPPYGNGPWTFDSVQSVYDKLPCTIGNSFYLGAGVYDPKDSTNYSVQDFSYEVNGPVEEVGEGFYLVTGKGKISVSMSAIIWERANKDQQISKYNACCHTFEKTVDICEVNSCTVGGVTLSGANVVDSTTVEVGKKVDRLSVSVDPTGAPADLTCSCPNYVVLMYMVDSQGALVSDAFTVDTWAGTTAKGSVIWYNPQGATGPNIPDQPIQTFKPTGLYSSTGSLVETGLKFGDCPFNLYGITFNYPNASACGYQLVVKVFGLQRTFDACGNMTVKYPMIAELFNPITVSPTVKKLSATATIWEGAQDPDEILAGVSTVVDITDPKFSGTPTWKFYLNGKNVSGVGVSPLPDGGYRFSNICLDNEGTFKIYGYYYNTGCTVKEEVTIELKVVKPTFTVELGLLDGTKIPSDGILTEGFTENVYVTPKDPRSGTTLHDFTTGGWHLEIGVKDNDCGLAPAVACASNIPGVCCGMGGIGVTGWDNPCLDDDPMVDLYFVSECGAKIYVTSFKLVPPTVKVDPTEVPFTIPATATHLTFTVTDAHGHGAPGVSVTISGAGSFGTGASGYTWTATGATTGKNGEADWAFIPPFSGKYVVTANAGAEVCEVEGADLEALGWGISTSATFEAVYKAPEKDTTAPTLSVAAPEKVSVPTVKVTGKATDNVGVTLVVVNDVPVTLLPDGTFAATVTLAEGANTIVVKAFDAAGNVATQTLTVTYEKPAPTGTKIVLRIGSDIMTVNGRVVQLDAAPEIKEGRTFLPLRAIAEAFGAQVTWVPETQGITVVLGNNQIGLQIGNNTAVVNGNVLSIVPPYIKNGRTMVPIRVIAEGFGAQVEWDPVNYIVTITMP